MDTTTNATPPGGAFPACLLRLTSRELDVLVELTNDLTNKEIGERLRLAHKSVANYRNQIADKLDMHGPRLLARFARRHQADILHWYHLLTGKLPPPSFSYITRLSGYLYLAF